MADENGIGAKVTDRDRPVRDYLTFVAWCAPALLAAAFTSVVLIPRLNKVIERSPDDQLSDIGKILSVLPDILFFHSRIILLIVVVIFVILELTAQWWPRWRRVCLMTVAWLVNLATLIGLCLLAATALLFAMS
jgi:hypothetical protein